MGIDSHMVAITSIRLLLTLNLQAYSELAKIYLAIFSHQKLSFPKNFSYLLLTPNISFANTLPDVPNIRQAVTVLRCERNFDSEECPE